MIEADVITAFQLEFFADATRLYQPFKLGQRSSEVFLFVVVFAKKEVGFFKLGGAGIVCNDALQPVLGSQIVFVSDFKFGQHHQGTGVEFKIAGVPHKAFQQLLCFLGLVDLPQHSGQIDMGLGIVRALRKTFDQGFKLVLGLKSAVALVVKGPGQQKERVVDDLAALALGDDDPAFLNGLGVFINRLGSGLAV